MMNYSKTQMSNLSDLGSSAGCSQSVPAGVKLEVLMEHLQRQQEANVEMNLQEKQLLQAQLLFARQAAAGRALASRQDSALFEKADGQTNQAVQQALNNRLSRVDPEEDDEEEEEDGNSDDEEKGILGSRDNNEEEDMAEEEENSSHQQAKKPRLQHVSHFPFQPDSTSPSAAVKQTSESPLSVKKQEHMEKNLMSLAFTSPNGFADWGFNDSIKQKGNAMWAEETDGAKVRGEPSRDFAKLYELDSDPQRKEFLDELFVFMQKRGTPVNRIPIMAKQVLDLYKLYKLVTEKGGLVEVINKKIWREITKGLNLPTSITSAAFTLRTQYMKYLYAFECEKKGLSSPGELQAAIDSNRREGRRPSYTSSLYRYSPSPGSAPHALLSSPKMQATPTTYNSLNCSASPNLKRNIDESSAPVIPQLPMTLALGQQQQQLAQAATFEHLRERLEQGAGGAAADSPEKKMMRLAEEQQRLMQQALQQNLLAMASHFTPMNLKLSNESKHDLSLNISTNGAASISVSVEVNGTVYSGKLFAQKSAASVSSQNVTPAGTSGFSALSSTQSSTASSPTSSKGPH
ncbi:AT-rich interactive domain-containing protein 3B-like [Archocentrus centrarchus]|uniref:AT-rich interactive domain-containing protein 3B-like n=1 Tax=Archocentrus centrarchus TaxID=63155 RepID=UPI0011EA283C|nr:AT-rich interactive domain-containing protein 3B-like [Archocentrus centrarchus]